MKILIHEHFPVSGLQILLVINGPDTGNFFTGGLSGCAGTAFIMDKVSPGILLCLQEINRGNPRVMVGGSRCGYMTSLFSIRSLQRARKL
jgi:hypothetical protein